MGLGGVRWGRTGAWEGQRRPNGARRGAGPRQGGGEKGACFAYGLNQVEIWFSILQRRVLRYGSFESLQDVARDVLGFIRHWNRHEAHPFRWTFAGRFVDPPAPLAA